MSESATPIVLFVFSMDAMGTYAKLAGFGNGSVGASKLVT
jgi:hypothetical protein